MQTVHQTSGEVCFDREWEVVVFGVTSFEEMMILVVVRSLTECWARHFKRILYAKAIHKHCPHETQLLCDDVKKENASNQLIII